jgi:4-amino-4-deoxy-L-arabinose transferase-like glycosyltransferase
LARDVFPFNADEAVVGLMARHILGGEQPTFFYGQAYMGSLDAFLVAGGFAVFGQSVWVIRLIQILLYLATIITTVGIGMVGFRSIKTGLLAGLFMAAPPVNSLLYTTVSLGGYGEALLLGCLNNLVGLILLDRIHRALAQNRWKLFLLWGFLSGLGLWVNGLTLVFSGPMAAVLLWHMLGKSARRSGVWKLAWLVILGGLLGSLPWWLYAMQNGLQGLVNELFGTAVAVEQETWLVRTMNHMANFLILGVPAAAGFRPPWDVRWLALPLIPLVLVLGGMVVYYWMNRIFVQKPVQSAYVVCGGILLAFTLAFVGTPFGVDPSGRYFLPLAVAFSLVCADYLTSQVKKRYLQAAGVTLLLFFNLWGTLDCAAQNPPGITTQFNPITIVDQSQMPVLMAFLKENGEQRGYTNYWVAYPLAFLSHEELIFTPRLPYQADLRYTPRDDRYAPYDAVVGQSQRVAFITTRNESLDAKIRTSFTGLGVTWQEKKLGDFQIFYHLSMLVRPDQIILGVE